jgi:hypothetical protein
MPESPTCVAPPGIARTRSSSSGSVTARGTWVPASQQTPGRVAVYDCFKPDRRRFDIDLVVDIARALGVDDEATQEWERICWAVQYHVDASWIVHVRTELPGSPLRNAMSNTRPLWAVQDLLTSDG